MRESCLVTSLLFREFGSFSQGRQGCFLCCQAKDHLAPFEGVLGKIQLLYFRGLIVGQEVECRGKLTEILEADHTWLFWGFSLCTGRRGILWCRARDDQEPVLEETESCSWE